MNARHILDRYPALVPLQRRFPLAPFVMLSIIAHCVLLPALPTPTATDRHPEPALFNVTLVRPPETAAPAPEPRTDVPTGHISQPARSKAAPPAQPVPAADPPPVRETTVSLHEAAHTHESLREYLAHMRSKIESTWDYPDAARRDQLQGIITLRFTVDAVGQVVQVVTVSSSGHALLDHASEATILQAGPFGPLPDASDLERLSVLASFHYSFSEE